ncbi:MAG: hypothetical protein J0L77_05665 [Alphaproteobacteria bacterium]|nr:hypothetical protein [Alphaproteobacteria bacterium]
MALSFTWFLFISLALIGTAGFNVANKLAANQIDAFLFTTIMTFVSFLGQGLIFAGYKFFFNVNEKLDVSSQGIGLAIIAGISVALINIGYFLAVKQGGLIPSQIGWAVGGTLTVTIIGCLFFKEHIDIYKLIGLMLAIISIFLIVKK